MIMNKTFSLRYCNNTKNFTPANISGHKQSQFLVMCSIGVFCRDE